jgi:putative drug exporter of the RND superfamily
MTGLQLGPIGRLGRAAAAHPRRVAVSWLIVAVGLGAFAPGVESALSGAGWEASGSQSVAARSIVQTDFRGLSSSALQVVVHSPRAGFSDPVFRRTVRRVESLLRADHAVASVAAPTAGVSLSRDGHTAIVQAGAGGSPTVMVAAADRLKAPLAAAAGPGVSVSVTGAPGMWSDFNAANRSAMMRSELLSWPVTLAILVVAFGSLVAAGLPLMLTILGLAAAAGSLTLAAQVADVSIWAMNFALMFALALGIDYALFVVARFRAAHFGSGLAPVDAVAVAMDTAGKSVLFSGLTVLVSLTAVMLVPSPAFRSMSLGIMAAVVFVLAATLTLLPAVLAKLGSRVDNISLPWVHQGEHRSGALGRWAELLWRHPVGLGLVTLGLLAVLAAPVVGLRTGMPSIGVVPSGDPSRVGYDQVQSAFGVGAPGTLEIVGPSAAAARMRAVAAADPGIAHVLPAVPGANGRVLVRAVPVSDPSSPAVGATIDRLRAHLPAAVLVGGAAAENHDLERALSRATPLVVGVVLTLGFVLLVIALQAPVAALIGVITSLLATGAAFGVARLVFQDGHGAGLLGFQPQGFLDAWGPVFFFAMIFAISMDYTVFLLSSAKEHWDRSGDAREAAVGGVAHSGRVILAAAAVMVAVFFTFAISGPLPPKEMGIILGLAVLLDALLVRLLLVPVLLRLAGRWAWWLPGPLERVLPDVRFGHG